MSEIPPRSNSALPALVGDVFRRLARRSRSSVERVAESGRRRMEIRQLEKDREEFWVRLGRTAYRLVEGEELEHPALRKAMARIDELEARIEAAKAAELRENGHSN